MADEMTLGAWSVSASVNEEGGITVEVSRDATALAMLAVPAPGAGRAGEGAQPRLSPEDMDF